MFLSSNLLSITLICSTLLPFATAVPVNPEHPVKIATEADNGQPPTAVIKEVVETRTVVHKAGCAAPRVPTSSPSPNGVPGSGQSAGGSRTHGGGNGRDTRRNPRVLAPAPHPDVNRRDSSNLRTCTKLDLYYGEANFAQNASMPTNHSMAVVHIPQLKYPAVELMSSDYISNVICNTTSAQISFNDYEAYSVAASNWTQQAGRFVMLSAFEGCRNAAPDMDNEYILVDKVIANDENLTIYAEITHSDFEEVVGADTIITVDLGTYSPSGGAGFNATASSDSILAKQSLSNHATSGSSPGLDSFDEDIDRAEGSTIAIDDIQYQQQLFPGLTNTSLTRRSFTGFSEAELETIYRRGLFDWFKSLAETIVNGTVDFFTERIPSFFTETLPDIIDDAIDWIEAEAIKAADALDSFTSLNKNYTGSIEIDYYPSDSHFQIPGVTDNLSAYQLYDSETIKAYCVQCGADGQVTITGTIAFSISKGFTSGKIGADGNLRGTVALGLSGSASQKFTIHEQHLVTVALSDLILGSLVQIGPAISLAAGAELSLSVAGELLAGVTLDWPEISATLDIVNGGSHATGFSPTITPIFHAAGRLAASTEIYSLISLELTVSVLAGQLRTSVALVDRPGVVVTAGIAGQASYSAADNAISGEFATPNHCAGIGISATIYNRLSVDVLGLYKEELHHWESDALETCVALAGESKRHRRAAGDEGATIPGDMLTATIASADGKLALGYARNGNVYALPSGQEEGDETPMRFAAQTLASSHADKSNNTIAVAPRIVFGTSDQRVLHGYRSELDTWGVSRLRVAELGGMPRQSVVVALGEVAVPAGRERERLLRRRGLLGNGNASGKAVGEEEGKVTVVMATDTLGEVLWPVLCNFEGRFSKVFLVRDVERGVRTLMGEEVKGRLLEEKGVTGCGYVPLVMG